MKVSTREILRAPIRGLELFGLAIAGLALVGSMVALLIYGDIFLLGNLRGAGNGLARGILAVAAVVIVVSLGLPRALTAMRRLANLTRRLSREWCGVPIPEPYLLPTIEESEAGFWSWSVRALGQAAPWRDAGWMFLAPIASPFLLLPLAAPASLGWFLSLPASRDSKPPALSAALCVATVVALSAARGCSVAMDARGRPAWAYGPGRTFTPCPPPHRD